MKKIKIKTILDEYVDINIMPARIVPCIVKYSDFNIKTMTYRKLCTIPSREFLAIKGLGAYSLGSLNKRLYNLFGLTLFMTNEDIKTFENDIKNNKVDLI